MAAAGSRGESIGRRGSEAIVDAFVSNGIDHVFGLPGTTVMELIDALGRRAGIRFLSVRHEQAAAHMADGFWRASGRLAAALASRGPGVANMAIGVHNAYAESIPLLALVGQVPDQIAHRDTFEEMDVVRFSRPMTKWAVEIHEAGRLPELVSRAIRTAQVGRPRPVLVSVPVDVQGREVEPAQIPASAHATYPAPSAAELASAVKLLDGAERPLIVAGGGLLRPEFSQPLIELAEILEAPVVTTWMRKNAFPNNHDKFAGTLGFGGHECADHAVREADVLLALGCRFSEFTTKRYTLVSPETRIVQVDVDAEEIGAVYPVAVGLVGDGSSMARALITALGERRGAGPTEPRREWAAGLRSEYLNQTELPAESAEPERTVASGAVVHALRELLRERDAILVQDAHSFGPWLARYLELDKAGRYYAAAGGAMGWGFPAALGVQAARPAERVIAVCGDGSFWMVAQEMETAVREDLPVVVVVTNNFSYGNTRDRQRHAHGGRYFGTFYDNPDFAAFAELLGAHGERVERGEDVTDALRRALDSGRPAIVDIIQDRHEGLPGDLQPLPAR
jgi:acetolactate synthase I/II/III large subunit